MRFFSPVWHEGVESFVARWSAHKPDKTVRRSVPMLVSESYEFGLLVSSTDTAEGLFRGIRETFPSLELTLFYEAKAPVEVEVFGFQDLDDSE